MDSHDQLSMFLQAELKRQGLAKWPGGRALARRRRAARGLGESVGTPARLWALSGRRPKRLPFAERCSRVRSASRKNALYDCCWRAPSTAKAGGRVLLARTASEARPSAGAGRPGLVTSVGHGVARDAPRGAAARAPSGDLDAHPYASLRVVGLHEDRSAAPNGGRGCIFAWLCKSGRRGRGHDQRGHPSKGAAGEGPLHSSAARCRARTRRDPHASIVSQSSRLAVASAT